MTRTKRIRWHDEDGSRDFAALTGYIGTVDVPQFKIYEPDDRGGEHGAEWLLTSRLPGQDSARYADDPDKLKAEAERWLERFVQSLGAIFPEGECPECGFRPPTHTHDKDCSHHRDAAPAAGEKGEQR